MVGSREVSLGRTLLAFLWDRAGGLEGWPQLNILPVAEPSQLREHPQLSGKGHGAGPAGPGFVSPTLCCELQLLRAHPAMGNTPQVKQIHTVLSSEDFQSKF